MRVTVSREPGAERVVSPLELFFDLVYVFAIGELSHHLLARVDLRTGAETVILALGCPTRGTRPRGRRTGLARSALTAAENGSARDPRHRHRAGHDDRRHRDSER